MIAPASDGIVTDDPSTITGIRSVACIREVASIATGRMCDYTVQYGPNAGQRGTYELAYQKLRITVWELHSGRPLQTGEIDTPADHCPAERYITRGTRTTNPVSKAQVGQWFAAHFVDGEPVG